MSCKLRNEQCCQTAGCKRPARHGELCTPCYMSATPAVRAVMDLCDRVDARLAKLEAAAPADPGHVGAERIAAIMDAASAKSAVDRLEALWRIPAFRGRALGYTPPRPKGGET